MAATVECENHSFAANGQKMLTLGWRELIPTDKPDVPLPSMSVGDAVATVEPILRAEQTTPPPRFNGASLIDAMEKAHLFVTDPAVKARLKETGIGTPATRAQIVESLVGRGYVTEAVKSKKKFYLSTPKGRALYTAVPDSLRKPDLTAYFEEMLKAVERAELPVATFMSHQSKFVHKLIDDVRNGSIAAGIPAGLVLEQPAPAPRRQTARRTSASPRRPRN
jgi:DNA topoisomerase-3